MQAAAGDVVFLVGGRPIERVSTFKYLGRVLDESDNDTKCIDTQIKKLRSRWWRVSMVLKRVGAKARVMARFYLAVVQAVLLYGSDSWTISKRNLAKLNVFHRRAVRHMTGQHIRKGDDGSWSYPDHEILLEKCRLLPIEAYITRRRATLRKYLAKFKPDLLADAEELTAPMGDAQNVLWGCQTCMSRETMREMMDQWRQ